MRKYTFLLAITAAVMAVHADTLTADQALARAMGSGPMRAAARGTMPRLAYTHAKDGQAMSYVFDTAEGGYLVLSADDAAAPVLGYSLQGSFDAEDMPDNMRYWLDVYAQEIEYARNSGRQFSASAQAPASWAQIPPMCTTKWNQSSPYNDLCPANSEGQHAVTGCVATAMAQKLNYHKYPDVGTGTKSNTSTGFPTITVNLEDYPFDWANMKDTYPTGSTQANRKAVAELMFCCGLSVNMKYGVDASAAFSENIPKALVSNFKYDKNCHCLHRDHYPFSQWQEFVYNELANVGPVLYSGLTAYKEGHSFICDGYEGNGYFHFNWGWGGISDGYFLLTALAPDAQGIGGATSTAPGFNYTQSIIVGAKMPEEGSQYYYELALEKGFNITESTAKLGSKITATAPYNSSPWACTGYCGLWITSQSGQKRFVEANDFSSSQFYFCGDQEGGSEFKVTLPSDLAAGTYSVSPAWRLKNGEPQDVMVNISECRAMKMVVNGTTATFSPIEGLANVQVADLKINSPKVYVGKSVEFTVDFKNTSEYEYYDVICSGLYEAEATSGTAPAYAGYASLIDIEAGQTAQWRYSSVYKAKTPGEYMLYFYKPGTYEFISKGFPVTLEAAPTDAETEIVVTDFRFIDGNTTSVDPTNVAVQFNIACTAGYYDKQLTVGISRVSSKTWRESFEVTTFSLFAGQSKSIQTSGTTSWLNAGGKYKIGLYQGTSASTAILLAGPIEFTIYNPDAGIDDVATDQAVQVQYFNLQGLPVDIDTAAPGVYVRVSTYANGSRLTDKIVK